MILFPGCQPDVTSVHREGILFIVSLLIFLFERLTRLFLNVSTSVQGRGDSFSLDQLEHLTLLDGTTRIVEADSDGLLSLQWWSIPNNRALIAKVQPRIPAYW